MIELYGAEDIIKSCAGKKVGISVSGGSDSMCLLDFVLRTGYISRRNLLVINFEHGIRGEESRRDSEFVAEYCERKGIELHYRAVDIPKAASSSGKSIETEARLFRKSEYDGLIASGLADVIMLAHNLNDNTETVLMHIFRGAGLKGLVGMSARDGCIIRPLISAPKDAILEYLKEHSVPYVTDSTNESSDYSRNYIRNELLPRIRSRWQVDRAISGLSVIARSALDGMSREFSVDGNSVIIEDGKLSPYAILEGFAEIGIPCDITKKHIEAITALTEKQCGAGVDVPNRGRAVREYNAVRLYVKSEATPPSLKITDCQPVIEKGKLRFDSAKLPEFEVRTRMPGDMFTPYGGKRKLLSDYLTDKKIPKYKRDKLALLASGSEVYAICGVEISDKIKIDESTTAAKEILLPEEE